MFPKLADPLAVTGSDWMLKLCCAAVATVRRLHVVFLAARRDLHGKLQLHTFFCMKYYHRLQGHELVQELFNDPTFQQQFQVCVCAVTCVVPQNDRCASRSSATAGGGSAWH